MKAPRIPSFNHMEEDNEGLMSQMKIQNINNFTSKYKYMYVLFFLSIGIFYFNS